MSISNNPLSLSLLTVMLSACGNTSAETGETLIPEITSETTALDFSQFPENLSLKPRFETHGQAQMPLIEAYEHVFYVSPDGADENPGSLEEPFRTFARAREAVRSHLDGEGHILVSFRQGQYIFDETQVLTLDDSGSEQQIITYASYPGEIAEFSSLVQLQDWQAQGGGIFRAKLPDGISHTRFLQSEHKSWLPRSATELFLATEYSDVDGGCLECNWDTEEAQAARKNVQFPAGFKEPDWRYAEQYDLRQSTISWVQEILPVDRVDTGDNRIYTQIPASLEMRLNFEEAENLNRNWVLNSLEGIDEAGEWASLDGYIYYSPSDEEATLDDLGALYVPRLIELIRVDNGQEDGNAEIASPVSHIIFDGISFTGGDFYTMTPDDITTQHDWTVVDAPTALLRLRNSEHIVVKNCQFHKSGSTGIRMDRYAQHNIIRDNRFNALGREAIVLSGRGPGYGDVSKENDISYNQIAQTGLAKWTAPAIIIDQSSENFIHHNYIENTEFTAIALTAPRQLAFLSIFENNGPSPEYLGREFHYFDIGQAAIDDIMAQGDEGSGSYVGMQHVYNHDNYVEYNTLVDVGQGAGYLVNGYVYNSAVTPGKSNYINYNYIHDSENHSANNAAFYSDSDQDYTSYIGNMISGMKNADEQFEPMPVFLLFANWAETESNFGTKIPALANVVINSEYADLQGSEHAIFDGTVLDNNQGSAAYLAVYKAMLNALQHELYSPKDIPGDNAMFNKLEAVIDAN